MELYKKVTPLVLAWLPFALILIFNCVSDGVAWYIRASCQLPRRSSSRISHGVHHSSKSCLFEIPKVSCYIVTSCIYFFIKQVFPDEVHLDTLHTYLKACAELHCDVKVHVILVALVERLAAYGQRQQSNFPFLKAGFKKRKIYSSFFF